MPEEDGYALIRRIRALPASAGGAVPAIAVTAYAREEDRLRALAAGFQAHVPKPVDPAELVAIVARLAAKQQRHRDDAASSHAPRPSPPPAGDNGHSTLPRILVVEDDLDSREGLRNLLEIWGHDVDVAEDGRKGIQQAIAHRPGVALIDIGLPDLDGYEVARSIRETLGKNGIYLVALTGYADAGTRQKALESGFDAHVTKPIDSSKLEALLESRRY
jgi:CheY-like chemotaxis protein